MKQGHYTFCEQKDAEDFAKTVNGTVIPDHTPYDDKLNVVYHVWYEYAADGDTVHFIDRLIESNIELRRDNKKLTHMNKELNVDKGLLLERIRRLEQSKNELHKSIKRYIEKCTELSEALDVQVHNNINMEYQLDKIKEIIKEGPYE